MLARAFRVCPATSPSISVLGLLLRDFGGVLPAGPRICLRQMSVDSVGHLFVEILATGVPDAHKSLLAGDAAEPHELAHEHQLAVAVGRGIPPS